MMIRTSLLLLPLAALLLLPTIVASTAAKSGLSIGGHLDKDSLPSTGQDWQTVSRDLEFQPNDFASEDETTANILREARDRMLGTRSGTAAEYTMQFVNGDETYYSDYAQAWRLLGFYIDCNAPPGYQSDCDVYDEDGNSNNNNNEDNDDGYGGQAPCQRYLMWAAYIDLDYQGGGIGEYQYFDRHSNAWSDNSCVAENGRCEKMDCHLRETNFKLLGFFKEPNYHSWMEQLFKHEGVCVWTKEEYLLMQNDRELWPCGCTETYTNDEDGNMLYYDTKPVSEGRITLGLYTDDRCSQDYDGELDVVEVLAKYVNSGAYYGGSEGYESDVYGDDDDDGDNNQDKEYTFTVATLAKELEEWNDAFDIYKKCQPCMAYDLSYNPSNNQDGNENNDDSTKLFDCLDDADYTSVNQCMKYRTHTEMLTADFRDIKLASDQGTIVEVEILGETYGSGGFGRRGNFEDDFTVTGELKISRPSIALFSASFCLLLVGLVFFVCAKKEENSQKSSMKAPLVSQGGGHA